MTISTLVSLILHSARKSVHKILPGRPVYHHFYPSAPMDVQGVGALRRSARLLSASSRTVVNDSPKELEESPTPAPTRKRRRKQTDNASQATQRSAPLPESSKTVSPELDLDTQHSSRVAGDVEENGQDDEVPSKPKKRTRRRQPDPVFIIPDVEKKETTFKGRLGYACLNTVLRNTKPSSESIFCSRTCRLDSLKKNGTEFAKDLGCKNLENLLTIIQWNEDHNIRLFRLSSEMFPYASHEKYGYSLEYCAEPLSKAGALARKYGHRLTTHPGQFTQLGSPKPSVVEAAIRDLEYHCQMLDLMGMSPDSVMVIHGGGVYGDKPTTIARLKESIRNLPHNVRQRLVLENDEMCYNAEDLLPICEELDVPLVFDYHHDKLFPSSIPPAKIIERANAIFVRRGIKPKQHLSEPRPGAASLMERRAHSDRCENLPPDLPDDMDLMIEAKDKEQAVFYLYRMYDLQPVIQESLRPATINPSMHTNRRKSTKRLREKVAKVAAEENEAAEDADTNSN